MVRWRILAVRGSSARMVKRPLTSPAKFAGSGNDCTAPAARRVAAMENRKHFNALSHAARLARGSHG